MRKVFIIVGLGGLAVGLATYYMQQYEILNNYKYRIVGGKLIKAGLTEVEIQVDVEVTNDSNISLTITDYYFDLYLNGVKVGSVANASVNQYLNKNGGKSFFPMRIKIATTEFLKGDVVLGLIESVKESTLQQKGYFGVKKGLFKFKNIPVDFTYKLKEFM